tara:strand:- start:198 stop:539 length:342 start_codon:yes stop_codon:yes gene_type:complete
METLQDYLNELDTFEIVSVNRDATEVHFSNGLKATYRVETMQYSHSLMVFQAVLQIRLIESGGDYMPISWGSTSEEQNRQIVEWFKIAERKSSAVIRSQKNNEYNRLTKQFRA